jgi:diguanylate cyclase (GGDEF)-like protein/PAS domain S-box-containing protein
MGSGRKSGIEDLIGSRGDACFALSESGTILAANRNAEGLCGWRRTNMVGRNTNDLCSATSHRMEERLDACRHDVELHHLLLENALDGILAHTMDGELVFANHAAREQCGVTNDETAEEVPWAFLHDGPLPPDFEPLRHLRDHGEARFELHGTSPGAGVSHREVFSRLAQSLHGPLVISTVRDVSQRLEAEEMVRYLAYHDTLTGLANRVMLDQELAHSIAHAERHGDRVGVVFIDLDDFKPINDTFGHSIGDDVLREIANRIAGCVREYDTVARVGGDEFVVVLPRLPHPGSLATIARKLKSEVAAPMLIGSDRISVSASLGLALYRPGDDASSILIRADHNMYRSRDRGRHHCALRS